MLGQPVWPRNPLLLNKFGVQLQASAFFERLTTREQLETFGALYGTPAGRVDEMLEMVALTDKADTRAEKLSGGQAQRLSIACALIHDPEIVFLDEPSAALDPQARRNLWDVLRAINERGKTVVLTTHYMEEAESLCDRVAIMDNGKILQLGPPAELVRALDAPVRISVEARALSVESAHGRSTVSTRSPATTVSTVIATRRPRRCWPRWPTPMRSTGLQVQRRRRWRTCSWRSPDGSTAHERASERIWDTVMRAFSSLSKAMLKGFYRDRLSLFFAILFPLFFILIFGTIFANNESARPKVIEVGAVPLIDNLSPAEAKAEPGPGGRTGAGDDAGRRARAGAEGRRRRRTAATGRHPGAELLLGRPGDGGRRAGHLLLVRRPGEHRGVRGAADLHAANRSRSRTSRCNRSSTSRRA